MISRKLPARAATSVATCTNVIKPIALPLAQSTKSPSRKLSTAAPTSAMNSTRLTREPPSAP